jgi:hypothetical protein
MPQLRCEIPDQRPERAARGTKQVKTGRPFDAAFGDIHTAIHEPLLVQTDSGAQINRMQPVLLRMLSHFNEQD